MRSVLVVAFAAVAAQSLSAQQPHPFSLDVSAGGGTALRQGLAPGGLVALDGMLALRVPRDARFMVAINAGAQFWPAPDCVYVTPDIAGVATSLGPASSRCGPNDQGFIYLGALGGFEWASGTGTNPSTVRLLAGPAYVRIDDGGWTRLLGFPARFDVATPHAGPVALFLSLQGTWVPNYQRGRYETLVGRLGLRLR